MGAGSSSGVLIRPYLDMGGLSLRGKVGPG